jgi:ABC-type nitrate/sulfonate/bicarbonate transport system permease component
MKHLKSYLPALAVTAGLLAAWELLVRLLRITPDFLPAPSRIVTYALPYWSAILSNTWQTVLEAVIGLVTAIGLGALTALALDYSATVRKALYPLLVTSQTIPIIALAPLLLIWIGYGLLPKVIIVTLYCFFPITIAMAGGLASVDPDQVNLFRTMRTSYWQTLKLLKIPSALPAFFAGLKISVVYAMTGAIVGEYVGAYKGLGIFIQTSANDHAVPLVFAAIFVTAFVSLLLFALVTLLERLLLPWRHQK